MSGTRDDARQATLEQLGLKLRRLERAHRRPDSSDARAVSSGLEAFDRLLPGGGLCGGTLLECVAAGEGSGAGTLAFVLARRFVAPDCGPATNYRAVRQGDTTQAAPLVVIDPDHEFYPPAAAGLGLDLDQTIVVRPESSRDVLWALEQSLRCPGVGVTLAWLDRVHSQAFRRLVLALETGGGLGLLLRPGARRRDASWAHVRLLVQPRTTDPGQQATTHHSPPTTHSTRRLHIHVLRGRKGHVAESLELELRDEPPDPVRLAAPLADSAAARRATGT